MRVLLDEVFGRERFIACNVWQKRYSRENREAIGDVHEYLFVYAMDPVLFKEARNCVPLTEAQAKVYKNPNDDPNGPWQSISMTAQGYRPNQMYEITAPNGRLHIPPEGRCWSLIEPEYKKLLSQGRIYFGKDGNGVPRTIRYLSDVEGFVPWTWWPHEEAGHTGESKVEIRSIFGTQTAFDTPKPTRLIERVIQIATGPGDLVLDSFAGSGTTGHAVLRMNAANSDEQARRFILVEMEESLARSVTSERVRRVAEGYSDSKRKDVPGLGGGFRFAELGEPLFDKNKKIRDSVPFADLARHVYFTETGEPLPPLAKPDSPLLGVCRGLGVYLLYNGILGDNDPSGGNILTRPVLAGLPPHDGPKVIYANGCLLGPEILRRQHIVFKQTPYEIKVS
jgi:hypothetical protein